jgi:chromate transporter
MTALALPTPPRPAGALAVFLAFSRMALMGFGGVLPIAQRELVDRLRWLSTAEFAELLSIGQVLPGPNVVNLAIMVGDRFLGLRGAVAAVAGMIAGPLVLVLTLASLYRGFADVPAVAGAVKGMGLVSAGLILAMGLKLLPTLARNPLGRGACALITAVVFAGVAWQRWPLVAAVLGVGGLSCALAGWRLWAGRAGARP